MFWLEIFRIVTLAWVLLCGIIVLALGGHVISVSEEYFNSYADYTALGVATGVLTLVTVPVMIALDFFLSTFTSWIAVELSWLSLLWILFLATAADAASDLNRVNNRCNFYYTQQNTMCHETQGMAAFAFLAWIPLMAYTITLLVIAILNSSQSANIWTSSIKDTFVGPKTGNQIPMTTNATAGPVVQPQPATQTV
ncbi:uncharacterized protein C8Q71DRAFT_730718 [Rhodofomes roseus]|uniref:MARVEL domain-containing protein n=1 Tax=Rhodofomes roseus TaxID=34475 RepID=A0A4Y9Z5T5_9APHY|nr:uncharacterized protein C8Q71DRAFT_730718 [Rhodofomes roseus]KAH9843966.1 hypothetical protein C8Q71DRAFT_730718 [Rhodofomes roseus]TFY69480.1 hypothetical protein EVJ58_g387 [Rhodofomes roseus]